MKELRFILIMMFIIKDDKVIKINFLNEQGRVKIIGGTLEKYKFIVSGENQNKNPWKKDLMNKDNVIPFVWFFMIQN